MTDQVISVDCITVNMSPDAFHRWAQHYYKCRQDFQSPDSFSPVPYFLLCRTIELEIKSRHLQNMNQEEVKEDFGHNLIGSYDSLNEEHKILDGDERDVLSTANEIYKKKGFEYFTPEHALRGYSIYPDLDALDAIAKKLIG